MSFRNRIQRGNSAGIIYGKRGIIILPEPDEVRGYDSTELVTLRLGGLDVVNGRSAPNPKEIDVNDPEFPGWSIQKYICATGFCTLNFESNPNLHDKVEIQNTLSANWVNAYLNVVIKVDTSYPGEFWMNVQSAVISETEAVKTTIKYAYNTGLGYYVFPVDMGTYSIKLATTLSSGKKIMVSCLQFSSILDSVVSIIQANEDDGSGVVPSFKVGLNAVLSGSIGLGLAPFDGWVGTFSFEVQAIP